MISYAQNGEDVILARALGGRSQGFYVDVGAASPTEATVTRHFYQAGWSGINFEPVPKWAAALRALRPRDRTVEAAAGSSPGELVFFEALDDPALSTTDAAAAVRLRADAHELRELRVPVVTLDQVLEEVEPSTIDFLKVDVEGAEKEVLAGIDLRRWRPRVIVVEATEPNSLRPAYADWEELVTSRGYRYASTDGINRYYVRDEEARLAELLVPVNSLDDYVPMREQLLVDEIERLRSYAHTLEVGRDRLAGELAALRQEHAVVAERLRTGRRLTTITGGTSTAVGSAAVDVRAPAEPARHVGERPERFALVSSPGTGALVVAAALGDAFGCVEASAGHPADLRLEALPERAVVELVWPKSTRLLELFRSHGFQVLTIARHPFDTLLATLRLVQVEPAASQWLDGSDEGALSGLDPTDERFLAWATSARAGALLAVSAGWWQEPGVWRLRFSQLATDLEGEVGRFRSAFHQGAARRSSPEESRRQLTAASTGDGRRFGLEEVPGGWRHFVSRPVAEALGEAHAEVLATFGFPPPSDLETLPSKERARKAWEELTAG